MLNRTRAAIVVVADLGGALGAVSMATAAVAGLAGIVVGATRDQPALITVGLGLTFGMAVATAVVPLILLRASWALTSGRGYRWRKATYRYRIDPLDHHHHAQTVEVEIVALRNGVNAFFNQYMWSGAGDDSGPRVLSAGHTLLGPTKRQRGWEAYVVEIQPALRKGDTATIVVHQDLVDTREVFLPFLAKTINEDCDELVLHVQLPVGVTLHRAWGATGTGPHAGAEELSRQPLRVTTDGAIVSVEWTVVRPRRNINYAIEWAYDGDRGLYSRLDDPASSTNLDEA
jgi:hypothetical protein